MKRWLFNIVSAVFMVLCLMITTAIAVQWARSSRGGELIAHNSIRIEPGREIIVNRRIWSTPGTLEIDWNEATTDTSRFTSIATVPKEDWVHKRFDGDSGHVARVAGDAPAWLVRLGLNWSLRLSPAPAGPKPNDQSRFFWIRVRYSFLLVTAVAVSLIPAIALWRTNRRWRQRRLPGFCQTCGYNLTANVSGICPECGTTISHFGATHSSP